MVVGFTLDKEDPSKRIQIQYASHVERAWCEAAELIDAGIFPEEAYTKWNEYMKLSGGYINNARDALLNAQVMFGLAKLKGTKDAWDVALEALTPAAFYGDDDPKKTIDLMGDIIETRMEQLIPAKDPNKKWRYSEADFAKATTETLFEVANLILRVFLIAAGNDVFIAEYDDNLYDCMQYFVDELLDRKEAIEKLKPMVKKLVGEADPTGFYKDIWEEEWEKQLS